MGDQPRRFAVRQFPAPVPPSRLQRGRSGRQVYDGAWPIIAGRRIALEFRFGAARRRARALPGRAAKARNGGPTGPTRCAACPPRGILDRCSETHTCPKIIEHFGAAEVWGLKLTPEWVGTDPSDGHPAARQCAPLLHRQHPAWRRRGGFSTSLPAGVPPGPIARATIRAAACLPPTRCRRPRPSTPSASHFRDWVMKNMRRPTARSRV